MSEPRIGEKGEGEIDLTLIGPLPIGNDVIGGTKISFSNLVAGLQGHGGLRTHVINTSRPRQGRNRIVSFWLDVRGLVHLVWQLWRMAGRGNIVMWNVSPRGAIHSAPLVYLICRFRRCRLIVRIFGGDFGEIYDRLPSFSRWSVNHFILSADKVLFQTKALVEKFKELEGIEWFPTTRTMPVRRRPFPELCRRFIYIGQLRPQKGIYEILEASSAMPSAVDISIAGPVMKGFDPAIFEKYPRVHYQGPLAATDVPVRLETHDALLFPSYYEGEGYPGIVIEALQMGLPVIATHWRSIPEIIFQGKNGLLIPPRDSGALANAMRRLSEKPSFFHSLQQEAVRTGETFSEDKAIARLDSYIYKLKKG